MIITRKSESIYFVETETPMADMSTLSAECVLIGRELKTNYVPHVIHPEPPIRVKLSAGYFEQITGLAVGESLVCHCSK
jgi:hypothetical protein